MHISSMLEWKRWVIHFIHRTNTVLNCVTPTEEIIAVVGTILNKIMPRETGGNID